MRRLHRGDLSAPVLAIIVTVGVIAAGLVLMAWFWWFAPQAGKTGALQIVGQPALVCTKSDTTYVVDSALISVKNPGTANITIYKVVIQGKDFTPEGIPESSENYKPATVPAGGSRSITVKPTVTNLACPTDPAVTGTILTDAGTYVVSFAVVK